MACNTLPPGAEACAPAEMECEGPTTPRDATAAGPFPIIDVSGPRSEVAARLDAALRTWGAFVCTGHGVDASLLREMQAQGSAFFALPAETKASVDLRRNGAAWRGYMTLGGERSEGGASLDNKEGLYCGDEHAVSHPRCLAKQPTWGQNVLPDAELPELRPTLRRYTEAVKALGDRMMALLSLALGLPETHIAEHVTHGDAISLVRVFQYAPQPSPGSVQPGIGSHSDYGLWTLLLTSSPGLEFRGPDGAWTAVPFVPGSFVMNAGDVLDRLTCGLYRSRHHRARNLSHTVPRLSVAFFYDPNWTARMQAFPLALPPGAGDDAQESREQRWAGTKITCAFDGRVEYCEFLAKKVAKVFPELVPSCMLATLDSTAAPSTRHTLVVPVPSKRLQAAFAHAIHAERLRVTRHPLYARLAATGLRMPDIRTFMEHHVWAVYDYFLLLKRLQRDLTCVTLPWRPTADAAMRRFISEIVLQEECDVFEDGVATGSHLELYLRGMEQAGADTRPMRAFLACLDADADGSPDAAWVHGGPGFVEALVRLGAPRAAAEHVGATMALALHGATSAVAAVFTFGREDVIPTMFSQLRAAGASQALEREASIFCYYLDRHIELDGEDHGPLALALVDRLCGTDAADPQAQARWRDAEAVVQAALRSRAALWDAVLLRV